MVRSQPQLLLRAMSESMATEWQESESISTGYIKTREHGNVLGQGSFRGP